MTSLMSYPSFYGESMRSTSLSEDRDQLERLSRYIQRPVIAQDRLIELEDGRFYYRFKRVWKSGAKGIFFEGPDLLERLAALIPPPRKHQIRYHGVYAPNSRLHKAVRRLTAEGEQKRNVVQRRLRHTYWVLWASLLKHCFAVDVSVCPHCQHKMQVIAELHTPEGIKALLSYDEHARPRP